MTVFPEKRESTITYTQTFYNYKEYILRDNKEWSFLTFTDLKAATSTDNWKHRNKNLTKIIMIMTKEHAFSNRATWFKQTGEDSQRFFYGF